MRVQQGVVDSKLAEDRNSKTGTAIGQLHGRDSHRAAYWSKLLMPSE